MYCWFYHGSWVCGSLWGSQRGRLAQELCIRFRRGAFSTIAYCTVSKESRTHNRTKHIDIKHHFLTELLDTKLISLEFTKGLSNPANILTKPLGPAAHNRGLSFLGTLVWGGVLEMAYLHTGHVLPFIHIYIYIYFPIPNSLPLDAYINAPLFLCIFVAHRPCCFSTYMQ